MAVLLLLLLSGATAAAQARGSAESPDCSNTPPHGFLCGPGDWLGECEDAHTWIPFLPCRDSGQICQDNACREPGPGDRCPSSQTAFCLATSGSFPDLANCRVFHRCMSAVESLCEPCPGGFAFDACARACSRPLGSAGCPAVSEPACEGRGERGTAPDNQRLYYLCGSDLAPHWAECSRGFFSVASGRCTSWDREGCSPCPGAGAWPLPNTSCTYLRCGAGGAWQERRCSDGWRFDPAARACLLGLCSGY